CARITAGTGYNGLDSW
nr:immunoglobulin heavy chain junction region [Macaca mulatta]MOV42343.1 immunoglobulin heavy chain junction region [Macaca mulatta]MOV46035.1 immunoglobulin heavy chain junction region [Macaca mulatta]